MAGSWLADESRQQAILFIAAAAFSRRGRAATSPAECPLPLLPLGPLASHAQARAAEVAGSGVVTGIDASVDALVQQGHEQDAGVPATAWTYADLIGWWLAAGEALGGLDVHQRNVILRMTGGVEGPMHPVLWCAERLTRLSLSGAAFGADAVAGEWDGVGTGSNDYRKRLFRWAVSPDRTRPGLPHPRRQPAEWLVALQTELREIGPDAVALFGKASRLRAGGELALATSEMWVAKWIQAAVRGRILNEMRRPVVQAVAAGSKVLIQGVAVLPPAQTLCHQLAALQASRAVAASEVGGAASLARATAFAAVRWQPGNLVSVAWPRASESTLPTLRVEEVEPAFLAVARWLTSAAADGDGGERPGHGADEVGELTEAMRIALALEGFQVRAARVGAISERMIPRPPGLSGRGTSLVFSRDASAHEAPLGRFGEAASCGPELFAAIEAVDWRLWAFGAAPWDLSVDCTREVVEIVRQKLVPSDQWEGIKKQALFATQSPANVEPLALLFRHAHERALALELLRDRVYKDKPADAMLSGLIEEYRTLSERALAALAAIDSSGPGQLHPPRLRSGAIDVMAWLARPGIGRDGEARYRLHWIRSSRPRGDLIDEKRTGSDLEIRVTVSAGAASNSELAILNAPRLDASWSASGHDEGPGGLADLLAACRRKTAFHGGATTSRGDVDPVVELRAALAGSAAAAFDEFMARCRVGDEAALAWGRILRDDPRFSFACHPPFDLEHDRMPAACLGEPFLVWEFDAVTAAGQDLAVTFALDPERARRVLSRGPRQSGSLAAEAELLAEACRRAGGELARLGAAALRATDEWSTFGGKADHPIRAVEPLLDQLLLEDGVPAACRSDVFEAAVRWCATLDHEVLPGTWRAEGRLTPSGLAEFEVPPEFDDRVPTGEVVIRRFGIRGVHGRPFSGAVSAGPVPLGYAGLRAGLQGLANPTEGGVNQSVSEVLRRADDLARHSLAGRLPLALPNLFDQLWSLITSASSPEARAAIEQLAGPLFEMLKATCRMVPFEPQRVGEYPAGWMSEADGSQPRGRRIKRLVRPGLRTIENTLVRPALVITE
jgi:hypothetical protein